MQHPVFKTNYTTATYIITVTLLSVIYTFTTSAIADLDRSRIVFLIFDAALYAISTVIAYIFLWNILFYGMPSIEKRFYRGIYIAALCIFSVIITLGLEALLIYTYFIEEYVRFITVLPLKTFVTILIFNIFALYYLKIIDAIEIEEESPVCDSSEKSIADRAESITRVTLKVGNGIKVIPVNEILYIKAEGDYISICTAEGSFLKEQTMKSIEQQLPGELFARIHRSFIVNISSLTHIERYGQQHLVKIKSGETIKISPSGYKVLKEKMDL